MNENPSCAIWFYDYVASMSWQNILTLVIVLGVAAIFVWRSSGSKDHKHGCHCGCAHENETENKKEKVTH